MLVTNHVLSGALIGAAAGRPLPAFLLGIASHFALDAVPHWGSGDDARMFLRVAVGDGLAGLTAMAGLTAAAPSASRAAVLAGMAGAALPDIDKPALLWFGRSPWPEAVGRFHSRIQDEAPDRFGYELGAAAAFLICGLMLRQRRSARH